MPLQSQAKDGSESAAFGGTRSEYSRAQLEASAATKDDFFARQMAANASKPEGLAPNQVHSAPAHHECHSPHPRILSGLRQRWNAAHRTAALIPNVLPES